MNNGTRIRTILFIVVCINQSIVSVGDVDFGNSAANVAYKVISTIATIIVGAAALYFNNDFTEEAARGTGITRQLKAQKKAGYIGEIFYDDFDEPTDLDEEEEDEDEHENMETDE